MSALGVNTRPLLPTTPSPLEGWFQDALNYKAIKSRALSGELGRYHQREFVLDFIARNGLFHQAAQENDKLLLEALLDTGIDPNALDTNGKSILANVSNDDLFRDLWKRGARYINPDRTILLVCIDKLNSCVKDEEKDAWEAFFLEIAPKHIPLEEYRRLPLGDLITLVDSITERPNLAPYFHTIARDLCTSRPEDAITIGADLLNYRPKKITGALKIVLDLIEKKVITNAIIEPVIKKILVMNIENYDLLIYLEKILQPQGKLKEVLEDTGDFLLGIYCYYVLETKTLEEAANLYSRIQYVAEGIRSLNPAIKQLLIDHIQTLQEKEQSTIWLTMIGRGCFNSENFPLMEELGFDPNWVDPRQGRNLLFSKNIHNLIKGTNYLKLSKVNHAHTNTQGDNALEHHCRIPKQSFERQVLVKAGFKVRDSFPNTALCQKIFPDNPRLQAELATFLLHPSKETLKSIFYHLNDQDRDAFKGGISNQEIETITGKSFAEPSYKHPPQIESWQSKFSEEGRKKLELQKKDMNRYEQLSFNFYLETFFSYWEGIVPDELLTLIPESPLVSLILNVVKKQHETSQSYPKKAYTLFYCLKRNDIIAMHRYLFNHPEYMRYLMEDSMKVIEVEISPQGSSKTTHAAFVHGLIHSINHLDISDFSADQKKLHESFTKAVPPVPKETLNIAENSEISLLGRTVLCKSENGCEAYKFLKPTEKYAFFSQEHSVSAAFNELANLFESMFITPIGVYAVRQLPPALEPYRERLSVKGPAYVFHYKANAETFTYLQDVPEERFTEARNRILRDGAVMIHNGVYPDSALFHNDSQGRGYVALVDLLASIIRSYKDPNCSPAGGAGRLDQPFSKLLFPNQRLSGWTDLRDASVSDLSNKIQDMKQLSSIDKAYVQYFYQMHVLSMLLFEDMLFLAKKWKDHGELQWQNEEKMKAFGKELLKTFSYVSAAYSDKPFHQYTTFFEGCGIDWTRAARQIAFWLDTSKDGYPPFVARGEVPSGLYEKTTQVTVDISEAQNFTLENGFQSNGPLALTEYEKALYLLFHPIGLAEPLDKPVEHVSPN